MIEVRNPSLPPGAGALAGGAGGKKGVGVLGGGGGNRYAHVCGRMLTCDDVC
jgi:hypothetical protein